MSSSTSFALAWSALRPYRSGLLLGTACTPVVVATNLWVTHRIGGLIDGLATAADDGGAAIGRACLALLALGAVVALFRFLARRLVVNASRRMERDLKDRLLATVTRLPMAFLDRAGTGDLISRLTQDVEMVRFMIGPAVLYGSSAAFMLPGAIAMMVLLSPLLTLTVSIAFVALLVSTRVLAPRLQATSQATQRAIGAISDRAMEDFVGIRVLASFARAEDEGRHMRRLGEDYLDASVHLGRLRALYNLMVHVSTQAVTLGVLVVGGIQVVGGALTIGELFQFLLLLGLMTWPLMATGWILSSLPRARAAMQRLNELVEVEPEPGAAAPPPDSPTALRGAIEVRGLTYAYPSRPGSPALRDVSFALPAGAKLGLVGPVGGGKSTLLALLTRLYDPPAGTVFVDGHDVLDVHAGALRRTFAVAPQDPFLFSQSVADNVRFGASDALDEPEVMRAVADAALDSDLPDLRDGLSTVVGERGVTLSGGQKQRLSLARALASGRPALMLDDTLSAVDPGTERRILARLQQARGGRTTLVASHRLSAVRDADLILVLDQGRVVQRGTHATLARAPGPYRRLLELQREADALEGVGPD